METPRRLVFCSYGDRSTVVELLQSLRGVDVAAVYFGSQEPPLRDAARFHLVRPGFKFPNFVELIDRYPEMLHYDEYLFLDDDLLLTNEQVEEIFSALRRYDIDLVQPSLSPGSKATWPHLRHAVGVDIASTNFVEIQCFALTQNFLRAALPYFYMAKTGYGLDVGFCYLLEKYHFVSAILHTVQMGHPPVAESETVRAAIPGFYHEARRILDRIAYSFGHEQKARRFATSIRVARLPAYPLLYAQLLFQDVKRHLLRPVRDSFRNFAGRVRRRLARSPRFPAYEFTAREMNVFRKAIRGKDYLEYGAGKSTLVAQSEARSVVAIEHEKDFCETLRTQVGGSVQLLLRAPDRSYTSFRKYGGDWNVLDFREHDDKDGDAATFATYVAAPPPGPYDVVLLDGRARIHCARHIYENALLRPGGVLLIHDFERRWYSILHVWFQWVETVDRMGVFRAKTTERPAIPSPAASAR